MPISYEPPAPVGAAVGLARLGAGGGVSVAQQYAAEMEARQQNGAIQAQLMAQDRGRRDDALERRDEFAASRAFSPRDAGMAQAQVAEIGQRAQAQAWLNSQELSQSENIRLQRLKQGEDQIAEQQAQGIISPDEAVVMRGQLRGVIDPLERRKAETAVRHQELQNQHIEAQVKAQARTENEVRAFHAKALPDRVSLFPDPTVAADVAAELMQDPRFLQLPDQAKKAALDNEVRRRGGLIAMYEQKPGDWQPLPGRGAGARGAADPKAMHESGLTAEEYTKHYTQAHGLAMKEQARTVKDEGGINEKYMHPQTAEWLETRTQQHLDKMLPKRPGAQGGGEAPAEWKPFDASRPEGASRGQREVYGAFEQKKAEVAANPALDEQTKRTATLALQKTQQLIAKHGSVQAMQQHSPADYRAFLQYKAFVAQLPGAPAPGGPPPNGVPLPPQEVVDPGTGKKITLPEHYGIRPVGG